MSVYQDKDKKTWMVRLWYKDFTGKNRNTTKRGFQTKREAKEWEREFLMKKDGKLDMSFACFVEKYNRDREGIIRTSTMETKNYIIEEKILPYFGKRPLKEITPADVTEWQNEMTKLKLKNGEFLSEGYLRSIHAVLSAIFNHAVNVYGLPSNPCRKAGAMGHESKREMEYWQLDEYLQFRNSVAEHENAMLYYAFETLFWTGIRRNELLALTPKDFDFNKAEMHIKRQYKNNVKRSRDTKPKTESGDRFIKMPKKLSDELQYYISQLYGVKENDRLFTMSGAGLSRTFARCIEQAGVKKIRLHDLRHSHVALLINNGFTPYEISKRMGHDSQRITLQYAHLYPSAQDEMAKKLDSMMGD